MAGRPPFLAGGRNSSLLSKDYISGHLTKAQLSFVTDVITAASAAIGTAPVTITTTVDDTMRRKSAVSYLIISLLKNLSLILSC